MEAQIWGEGGISSVSPSRPPAPLVPPAPLARPARPARPACHARPVLQWVWARRVETDYIFFTYVHIYMYLYIYIYLSQFRASSLVVFIFLSYCHISIRTVYITHLVNLESAIS